MGNNYSKEQLEAFKRKDMLNSRMSALKAVSLLFEGLGASEMNLAEYDLRGEADVFYAWLTQDQDWAKEKDVSNPLEQSQPEQLPLPTAKQQSVVNAICNKLAKQKGSSVDTSKVKTAILDIAEKEYGVRSYPSKKESVDFFVNKIKSGDY